MSKKINYSELIKETLILTVAVAVIAAAVFFFLVPSHASVSSISGLGIVLSNFIPIPLPRRRGPRRLCPAQRPHRRQRRGRELHDGGDGFCPLNRKYKIIMTYV